MVRLDNEEIYGTRLYLVVARAIAKMNRERSSQDTK